MFQLWSEVSGCERQGKPKWNSESTGRKLPLAGRGNS